MAESKPLALRRQKVSKRVRPRGFTSVAEVVVNHSSIHLAESFTYGVPEALKEMAVIGSWVLVPFQNQELEGVVLSVTDREEVSVKPIVQVFPVLPMSDSLLRFAQDVALRYGARLIDVLRYVPKIPGRKSSSHRAASQAEHRISFRSPLAVPVEEIQREMMDEATATLAIFPTEREAAFFAAALARDSSRTVIHYRGDASAAERKKSLVTMESAEAPVVFASRSGIFLDIPNLSRIYLFGNLSEHLWERRAPYWNVRDVALLRARSQGIRLDIVDGSPSMELARLIELGAIRSDRKWIRSRSQRRFTFAPDTYHAAIREGLKVGPVLVSVAEKGYSSSFICQKCRSTPRCACGGRMVLQTKGHLQCSLCQQSRTQWRCLECESSDRLLIRRGAERIHEEIGKAFPNIRVEIATSDRPFEQVAERFIVIATSGMEPLGIRYAGLALLDGELHFNRPMLRASEVLLSNWSNLVSRTISNASVFVSLESNNPIAQALLKSDGTGFIKRELAERKRLNLPPWYRIVQVMATESVLGNLMANLKSEYPYIITSAISPEGVLTIRIPVERSEELVSALFALQKYRSAARLKTFDIKIDPITV